MAATDDLHAFLLKAPHHGSDTSSTPALLSAVHPAVVVFSVGPRNRFHFPRADVWRRYAQAGALGLRTDLDGAIAVETDGRTVTVTPTAPGTSAQHFKLEPLSPSAEPW